MPARNPRADAPDPRLQVRAMEPGETRSFRAAPGQTTDALRQRLSVLAHRAWGKGTYATVPIEGGIALTRCAPPPPPPALSNDDEAPKYLTRAQAAAWLSPYFPPDGLTARQLTGYAVRGRGPQYVRSGRDALYREADLIAWVRARMRPPPRQQAA